LFLNVGWGVRRGAISDVRIWKNKKKKHLAIAFWALFKLDCIIKIIPCK
jgi:hypothetical protein